MKKLVEGSRIIKTGVAIFLTALICEWLGWPAVFAVITAIVTVEPTISDSIKKGMVRFPASAIGSAYAVTFISLFGNSPITYTLAAVLTIATCYKLHLHSGLLVATLTSVAMIEVVHEHFFIAFLIRLGTTTIGLAVSTVVNMFVLPPDYRAEISEQMEKITEQFANVLNGLNLEATKDITSSQTACKATLAKLDKELQTLDTLVGYEKSDSNYRRHRRHAQEKLQRIEKQAALLRKMHGELHQLAQHSHDGLTWTGEEKEVIQAIVSELAALFLNQQPFDKQKYEENKSLITHYIWGRMVKNKPDQPSDLPAKFTFFYELFSFHHFAGEFFELGQFEDRSKKYG